MSPEYLPRNVKRETEEHYRNRWPFAADARRNLYLKYARKDPPWVHEQTSDEVKSRDMWCEVADDIVSRLGDTSDKVGLDVGTSSGYFVRKLYSRGYNGRFIGVDIEMETQPGVETIIKSEFPTADIVLGGSDAQSLKKIDYYDEDDVLRSERVPDNYFDFLTELFVLYHVPDVKKAYNAAHRVVKPGGLIYFSGRHVLNQNSLWQIGNIVADHFNIKRPDSFYSHHSLDKIERHLTASPKFELLDQVPQIEDLWIKADEEGWQDYKWAILTLPYGRNLKTGSAVKGSDMAEYLETQVRPEFEHLAAKNNGYFIDNVFQTFYITRALK